MNYRKMFTRLAMCVKAATPGSSITCGNVRRVRHYAVHSDRVASAQQMTAGLEMSKMRCFNQKNRNPALS